MYHNLKKVIIFYKVGYYAHSHKAKKLIREKLKITVSLMTSQFPLPHHEQSLGDGLAAAV